MRWKHDGHELETGRDHVTLVIADFDETTHGGVYQCSAELAGVGRAVSDHATLRGAGTSRITQALFCHPKVLREMNLAERHS